MILRKPYAFFIKHFRLFNIVLSALNVYAIYKMSFLLRFFSDYSDNPIGAIGQDLTGTLLSKSFFVVCVVVIFFCLLLIGILSLKKKPIKLYLCDIIVMITTIILIFISHNILSTIEIRIIENRTVYLMRDFSTIVIILQVAVTIVNCMRSIGFDIKSFSFGKDLEKLNIDVSDNEEFELQIDVDSSKFQRNFNKNKRYFKYFIYEHKFMIVLTLTIMVAFASYFIYSRMGIYFDTIKPEKMVNIDNFVMGIEEGYTVTEDYRGNKIVNKNNTLIVVPIQIKTNSSKEKINITRFKLVVGKQNYYHNTSYNGKLIDLGEGYNNQIIDKEFKKYILVFEIPKNSKNMYLEYDALNEKSIKFKIITNNIDEIDNISTTKIGETVVFNNNIINDGTMMINSFEINNKFKVDYKLCITQNECYDSYEYIVPNYMKNYDKTVLKINGNIEINDSDVDIKSLYDFISKFGVFKYTVGGQDKMHNVSLTQIIPSKTNLKNTYYIEVLDELKDASSISLEFNIRNNKYIYILK